MKSFSPQATSRIMAFTASGWKYISLHFDQWWWAPTLLMETGWGWDGEVLRPCSFLSGRV